MLSRFAMKKIAILDIGCGTGNGIEIIPFGNYYIGVDLSFSMLYHMRERFKSRAVQADGYFLPMKPEAIDLIFAAGILEYQKDARRFLKSIIAPLKRGGHIFLTSSPPTLYTDLRKINGSMVWPRTADEVIAMGEKSGLTCLEKSRSLLQEQFLFIKN
ncbi:MAG: methyltransferase domain-containing protein [Chitinivibrionales bacterium]|nr:methyltransferase domain-containing protein [Chitinivibrionales bacterium]